MRKMTKTVAVVAAMSALTVASASVAFAAEEIKNVSSLSTGNEAAEAGETLGTWSGNDGEGWSFKTEDGKKFEDTWAEIDGVWYYFDGDKIAQDRVLWIDEASYFFDKNGRLATGWQKITSKMDAYSDIEIPEQFYNKYNSSVDVNNAYDWEDYVWCYFDENGVAKENEWFQSPESGLWYYFDGNVMVQNIYNYEIEPDNYDQANSGKLVLYGFDKNGAMLTGWNSKDADTTWNNPTADAAGKTWYYYATSGKMQTAGWKEIGGKWYLFADYDYDDDDADAIQDIGYPLIVNSYVASNKNASKTEYFYVDKKGVMQTGVVKVPKDAYTLTFYQSDKTVDVNFASGAEMTISKDLYVNFGSKGNATQALVDGKYYLIDKTTVAFDEIDTIGNTSKSVYEVEGATFTTGAAVSVVSGSAFELVDGVQAQRVKNAFIWAGDKELYVADEDGNLLKNKVIKLDANEDQYIIFSGNGKAYTGYDAKEKSVTIGGVTYWSTDIKFGLDGDADTQVITVFSRNK